MSQHEISLIEQADEAAHCFVNLRGHRDNIKHLVGLGKRPAHELQSIEARLPILEQMAATLRFLADNPDAVRSAIIAGRRSTDEAQDEQA